MSTMVGLLILSVLIMCVLTPIMLILVHISNDDKNKNSNSENENTPSPKQSINTNIGTDTNTKQQANAYTAEELIPYRKNDFIFSNNEYACYKNLKIIADKYDLEIFSKTRFADLVSVNKAETYEWQKYFNKIKAKHIDFVLLDNKYMKPKLLIELDDRFHNRPDRIERDNFVNSVCQKCNLPILHTRNYTLEILENDIKNKIGI